MKVLVYGINYFPELTGIGKYSGEMCTWMAKQGHQIRVITGPPYYPEWSVAKPYTSFLYKKEVINDVVVMRCPLYVPKNQSTIKRLLHLGSFAVSSGLRLLGQVFWRPDVIICIVPSQFCSPMALLFSRITSCKSVIHIQDYELDAMFGLGMSSIASNDQSRIKKIAFGVERWLLRGFDRVSSISNSMLKKATSKGVSPEKLIFFPNWSETERFISVSRDASLRQQFNIPLENKIILYSGNIGQKQGLDVIVDAAYEFKDKPCTFLIVGQGAGKKKLEKLVVESKLTNIIFSPLLPYEQLPELLAMADCHLVIQRRGVADAVLPSKLTNILAVGGQAVITADIDTELWLLCEMHPGIAECVTPECSKSLLKGIESCLTKPKLNAVAQNYARQFIDRDKVLDKFISDLKSV